MKIPALAGFRQSLEQGRRARIVVPTATLAEHLRHELVREGLVFRARDVSTLSQFVQELAPEITVAAGGLFHLMLEDALRRLDVPEFRKVADLNGFQARLARTLSDLDAAGCTSAQVADSAIRSVWQDVEHQMRDRKLVMRGESLRIAAAAANKRSPTENIWFEGFAQLSLTEITLLEACGSLPAGNPTAPIPTATRMIVAPETAEREVEEIARRILENPRFLEIGVVLRKPEKYVPLLRAAFERFGIPAHFYFPEPLPSHPAARLLTGTVEALLKGWEHEQVLELFRLVPGAGAADVLDEFAVKVRKNLPGRELEPLLELCGARWFPQRILKSLQQIDGWRRDRRTPDEWAARLNHLPSLFAPTPIPDHISKEEAAAFRFHAAGLKAFAKSIECAASWWVNPSELVDLAKFWQVARSTIRVATFAVEARSRNVVHVISAGEARQWSLGTLFICGMVEKDFPAQHARDPFLPDAALREMGVRTSREKDDEEFALFNDVCSRAQDLLVLSFPRVDSRGQRNLKSIFLTGMAVDPASVPVVRPQVPAAIAPWLPPSKIQAPDLLGILAGKHAKMSVTALESLLQCPFQFFAKKTLRIAEMPCRPEDRLDFLLQGNIAHDVLGEWFTSREELEPLFRRRFDAACEAGKIQPGFRTDRLRRVIHNAVRNFTRNDQYPLHWKAQIEKPFELALNEHLTISGKLDRVDEPEDGRPIVLDYKYSPPSATKKRLEDETKLQGPLYAWAVEKEFGHAAAAMVYVSLKDPERPRYFGWGEVTGTKFRLDAITPNWIPDALERASRAAAGLHEGKIRPQPATIGPCRYCDSRDACRNEQPIAIPAR